MLHQNFEWPLGELHHRIQWWQVVVIASLDVHIKWSNFISSCSSKWFYHLSQELVLIYITNWHDSHNCQSWKNGYFIQMLTTFHSNDSNHIIKFYNYCQQKSSIVKICWFDCSNNDNYLHNKFPNRFATTISFCIVVSNLRMSLYFVTVANLCCKKFWIYFFYYHMT